jgi:hypothetical protein
MAQAIEEDNPPVDTEKGKLEPEQDEEPYSIYGHRSKVLMVLICSFLSVFSPSASSIYVSDSNLLVFNKLTINRFQL